MKLIEKQSGKEINVADEEALKMVSSDMFDFSPNAEVAFTAPDGRNFYAPGAQAGELLKNGWQMLTADQAMKIKEEKEFGGDSITNELTAGALGAARGLTFGLSDYLIPKTGLLSSEDISNYKEYNPNISTGSDIAATIAPVILSGGASLLGKAAGSTIGKGISKAGGLVLKAEEAAKAVGIAASKNIQNKALKEIAKVSAEAATENVLFGLGREISEVALGDKEFNAASVATNAGFNALLGAGGGLAIKGLQKGSIATYMKGKKEISKKLEDIFGVADEERLIDIEPEALERTGAFLDQPLIRAKKDVPTGVFKYEDNIRSAPLNLDNIKKLDLDNTRDLTELGSKLGIPGLPDFMEAFAGKIEDLPNELAMMKAVNFQIKMGDKFKIKPAGFAKLEKKFKKEIENELLNYDAFILGDELVGVPGRMRSAFTTGTAKGKPGAIKKVEPREALWLKALGATQSDISKIRRDFAGNEIKEAIEVGKTLFRNKGKGVLKPFLTATDEFVENLNQFKIGVDADMDSAVAASVNLLNEYPGFSKKQLTTNQLATWVEKNVLPEMGEITSARSKTLDIINRLREGESYFVLNNSGKKVYRPLDARAYRDIRADIDELANFGRKENVPKAANAARRIRSRMEDELIENISELPRGKEIAEIYKKAKKDYRSFFLLENLVDKMQNKQGNNTFGLSSTILGAVGLGAGGALPGVAAAVGTELVRRHGSLAAAKTWEYIAKDQVKLARLIDDAITNFLTDKSGKAVKVATTGFLKSSQNYEQIADKYAELASNMGQFENNFENDNLVIKEAAPENFNALMNTAITGISFINAKMPKPQVSPFGKQYNPSDYEMSKFMRYVQAVENPKTIIENIKAGYVSNEELETLKMVYPAMYKGIQDTFLEKTNNEPLSYKQRSFVSKLFGMVTDKSLEPASVLFLQQSFQPMDQNTQLTKISKNVDPSKRSMSSLDRTLDRRTLE